MIATVDEIKSILGKTTTYLSSTDINTVIGDKYEIYTNTTGDFVNVGATDNNVGTVFVATGDTPTDWGDGVLKLITAEDEQIASMIEPLTTFIVEYTNNDFTKYQYITAGNRKRYAENSLQSSTFSFTEDTIDDSDSGLDFLKFNDFKIVGLTNNDGYYTAKIKTASSITIADIESFEVESAGESLTLYGVRWPKDLAKALSLMVNDVLNDESTSANAQAETIGKYSVTYGGGSNTSGYRNETTYNSESINILNNYIKVGVL